MGSPQQAQPNTITEHLRRYGIRTFTSDAYWDWAEKQLGRKARVIDKLQEAFVGDAPVDPRELRRFYDTIADPTVFGPAMSEKADDVAQGMKAITEATAGRGRILEVGCSLGYISTWLALQDEAGRKVVGIDYSARSIKEATRYAARWGIQNVSFVHGDLGSTLPEGPFDAVVDSATLQYVPDRVGVLHRIRDQTAPDGILVSVPQLGRVRDTMPFLAVLRHAGFSIRSFSFVYATELGRNIARPLIVADTRGEGISVDVAAEFSRVTEILKSQRIRPLSETEALEGAS